MNCFDEEIGGSDFIKLSFSCFHLHEFEHESILQASQRSSSRENFFKKKNSITVELKLAYL